MEISFVQKRTLKCFSQSAMMHLEINTAFTDHVSFSVIYVPYFSNVRNGKFENSLVQYDRDGILMK